jgi:hypothetical protein
MLKSCLRPFKNEAGGGGKKPDACHAISIAAGRDFDMLAPRFNNSLT